MAGGLIRSVSPRKSCPLRDSEVSAEMPLDEYPTRKRSLSVPRNNHVETATSSSRDRLDAQADEALGGGGNRGAVSSDQTFGIVMQDLDGGKWVR